MKHEKNRCRAFTRGGERCKIQIAPARKYCHKHVEEFSIIESFFGQHKDYIVGFLTGVLTETIIDDVYELLKRSIFGVVQGDVVVNNLANILNILNRALPILHIQDHVHKVEFHLAKNSPPYSLFECHFLKEASETGLIDLGIIGVFYNDERGRRFIGEAKGYDISIEYGRDGPSLLTTAGADPGARAINCYELKGPVGRETLALTKEYFLFEGSKAKGRGSIGPFSWHVPE